MIFLYIYLAFWAVTFAYAVYESNRSAKKLPFIKYPKFMGIMTKAPMWFLLLLSIIVAPIGPIIICIDRIRQHFSLSCKKVPQNESQEMIRYAENLPENTYTEVSTVCAKALASNQWDAFAHYLTPETLYIEYGKSQTRETLSELKALAYLLKKRKNKENPIRLQVEICRFIARTCVVIGNKHDDKFYLLFRIVDNKITHIIHAPLVIDKKIDYDPFSHLAFNMAFLNQRCGEEIAEPLHHHMPCMQCGTPSHELQWRTLQLKNKYNILDGLTSICPHCQRQTEYFPIKLTPIPQPEPDEKADLPF
jgi:hypothetical protein